MTIYIKSSLCSYSSDINQISVGDKKARAHFENIQKELNEIFEKHNLGIDISAEQFGDSECTRIVLHNSKTKKWHRFVGYTAYDADLSIEDDPTFEERLLKAFDILWQHKEFMKIEDLEFYETAKLHFC